MPINEKGPSLKEAIAQRAVADRAGPLTRGGWTPSGTGANRRMAHSERSTPRWERTRRLILDAARRVFEGAGYFDVNVNDIVAEAGVARGSFYSDVASLQTRAAQDGDEWVINGQKLWTTYAQQSDFGLLLARTDPDRPKHAGISMFIVDMTVPGVEIRPIHQIDGGSHFNEVFFRDVRVPADRLVGSVNEGWRLATSMLMYECVAIGSAGAGQICQPNYDILVGHAQSRGVLKNPAIRDQLMQLYIAETCKSLVALRTSAELKAGGTPGPGGSIGKLLGSNVSWLYRAIAQDIAGPISIAWSPSVPADGDLQLQVLRSFQDGIAGGTDEI